MELKSCNSFIKTQKNLEDLLEGYGVETYKWGMKGNKSVKDLFEEIQNQTTELFIKEGKILIRKVRADSIYVYYSFETVNNSHILLKLKETVRIAKDKDGIYRTENLVRKKYSSSLGTELKIGEDPKEAAVKCLKEKLGIKSVQPLENERFYTRESTATNSLYPTIKTIYETTEYNTHISSIDFNSNGYCLEQNDRLCIWEWEMI